MIVIGGPYLRDVPNCLRLLADRIEHGEEPEMEHILVVGQTLTTGMRIYSYGGDHAYPYDIGLLHLAQTMLTDMCMQGANTDEE